jgi:hypothetical protein
MFVIGQDRRLSLYSLTTQTLHTVEGAETNDSPIQWGTDGHSAFVWHLAEAPARIYRLDFGTGKRQLLRELPVPDPAGLELTGDVSITPEAKSYAFSYGRTLSELYVVDGLK